MTVAREDWDHGLLDFSHFNINRINGRVVDNCDADDDDGDDICSLFVPKDDGEETLLLLLISESIVRI